MLDEDIEFLKYSLDAGPLLPGTPARRPEDDKKGLFRWKVLSIRAAIIRAGVILRDRYETF